MKRILFIIIASFITHISFGQKISTSEFVGVWEMVAADNTNTSYASVGSKLTVRADGTASAYDPDVDDTNELKWRLDGDLLFLYVNNNGSEQGMYTLVVSHSGDKLVLAEKLTNPYKKNFVYRKQVNVMDAKVQVSE